MRIHRWSDVAGPAFRPPPLLVKEEGSVLELHDHPRMYDMQVGDIIRYQTSLGTAEFRVDEVRPAELMDYPLNLNLVTAKKTESEK